MTTKTDQDKLRAVVERSAERWAFDDDLKEFDSYELNVYNDCIRFECVKWGKGEEKNTYGNRRYTVADLISDKGFMDSAYGADRICHCCATNMSLAKYVDAVLECLKCEEHNFMLSWQYHSIQALKLIQEGGDAIGYLYENLPKV